LPIHTITYTVALVTELVFFSEHAETQINFSLVSPLKKRRPSFNGFFQNEKCEKNLNCSRIYSYINSPPIICFFLFGKK